MLSHLFLYTHSKTRVLHIDCKHCKSLLGQWHKSGLISTGSKHQTDSQHQELTMIIFISDLGVNDVCHTLHPFQSLQCSEQHSPCSRFATSAGSHHHQAMVQWCDLVQLQHLWPHMKLFNMLLVFFFLLHKLSSHITQNTEWTNTCCYC